MISCNDYDYIEIVCLYHYPVKLFLRSGDVIEGIALDTKRNEDREECIELKANNETKLVKLDTIAKLHVTKDNPHFTEISFS